MNDIVRLEEQRYAAIIQRSEQTARVNGDTALVWVRRDGAWRLAALQSGAVPKP